LDSRVVDVPLVYNLVFAMLSALKLLFFKSLKMRYASRRTRKHKTPESNKSDGRILLVIQFPRYMAAITTLDSRDS
jgi:hypothetical protein